MEYRFIKKDDINSVFLLGRPHFGLETEYSWDWSKEKIKQYLNKSFGFGVICVAKNYIVGFALIQKKYSSQKPNVAWINYLFVVKKYRQKNIGSDLLKFAFSKLKDAGKTELIADVYLKNKPSLNFFQSNKFKVKEKWLSLSRKL